MKTVKLTLLLLILLKCNSFAQEKDYYFYHPEIKYGSELSFDPLTMFLNGSLDILRNGSHENNGESKNIFRLDYGTGIRTVWNNISDPVKHINRFGWKNFISTEIFPISTSKEKAHYIPNYTHHVIGAGMLYVKTTEWFDYHGFKYPHLYSIITATAYQYMNEVIENNHYVGSNVDPIADLLIFNPLGYLLFSFDSVNRFFSKTIRLYDWSLQPVYNPVNQEIENAGQQFIAKFDLPFETSMTGFVYWGIYGIAGLTIPISDQDNFSFGAGTVVNSLNENRLSDTRFLTPNTDGSISFFYDRNHSLMASAIITGPRFYNVRFNVYPGFFKIGPLEPGFYGGLGEWDNFQIGVTFAYLPIGLVTGKTH
ncbi:MAG: hypothetical protein D8M58_18125 [Calditrichaeota bacterium]|nr:MAG: hypothetical protein DWQ03_11355 [Calditrichota bacterium]MBL1207327.1 hypothetical protein [Calditrichota bacterium]NOG47159.1 hypothetical protein [Calditrichota bacterium]